MISKLINFLRARLAIRAAARRLAAPHPRSAIVMDIDYIRRARNRGRVRFAAVSNQLTAVQTADLLALFDAQYDAAPSHSAGEDITQALIERAAATARRRDTAAPWQPAS